MDNKEAKDLIVKAVEEVQGCKATELVSNPDLIKVLDDANVVQLLDELVVNGELVAVEYSVPSLPFPAYLLLPKGSIVEVVSTSKEAEPKMELISDFGEHMTMENFVKACCCDAFIDDDGFACYANEDQMSDKEVSPSDVNCGLHDKGWTHVVWFNR